MVRNTRHFAKLPSERVRLLFALLAVLTLLGAPGDEALAQSVAVTHCGGQCPAYRSPVAANQSTIVIHHLYAAGISGVTSLPDWVAYRLTPEAIGVASLLPRSWQPDRLVKFSALEDIMPSGEEEVRLSDNIIRNSNPYGGGGIESVEPENRVRLAPMTSFANTPYWRDLNNFSNMLPMPATLRLGPWVRLEQRLNQIASAGVELTVIAGPVYLDGSPSLNFTSAEIEPAGYYKLVSDGDETVAFLFPRAMDQLAEACTARSSVAELAAITGLKFFPGHSLKANSSVLLSKLGCH